MDLSNTLNKTERLKRRKVIDQLFRSGQTIVASPVLVYFSLEKLDSAVPAQAGFAVSAKNFRKAVDRNRIKRILREVYRLQKQELYSVLLAKNQQMALFFVFTGKSLPAFELIKNQMSELLAKLVKIINEIPAKIN